VVENSGKAQGAEGDMQLWVDAMEDEQWQSVVVALSMDDREDELEVVEVPKAQMAVGSGWNSMWTTCRNRRN
jgi:hypothetical protein